MSIAYSHCVLRTSTCTEEHLRLSAASFKTAQVAPATLHMAGMLQLASPKLTSSLSIVMKAIVQNRYGSADTLEIAEIERPTVGDSDVLIRVHAASLHIGDSHVMTGK